MADPRKDNSPSDANQWLLDRTIRHSIYMQRVSSSEAKKILEALNDDVLKPLMERLRIEFLQMDASVADGRSAFVLNTEARFRLERITAITQQMVASITQNYGDRIEAGLIDIGEYEIDWQADALQDVMRQAVPNFEELAKTNRVGINVDFDTPSIDLIRASVEHNPFQGKTLRGWMQTQELATVASVRRNSEQILKNIRRGLAEGDSINGMVRRVMGEAGFGKRGAFSKIRSDYEGIVRTAVTSISNEARHLTYQNNADLIKGIQFVATLDSRTTVECGANDGKIFDIDKGPRPPLHFRCRSSTVPVLKSWKELGIDLKEAEPPTRAFLEAPVGKVLNGQVPGSVNYEKWLKGQSKELQDDILGPGRADVLRRGVLKFEDFIDSLNRPLSLQELINKERIAKRRKR